MAKKLNNLLIVLAAKKKDEKDKDKKADKGEKDKKVLTKSQAAKKAEKGEDLGKKGKNFDKIADKAGKEYGSKKAGDRVAGAIFQKMRKSGKL